jgi:hypothetical protein
VTERDRNLEISLRLKAARWLAGQQGTGGRQGDKPRSIPLSTEALAARSPLPENKITADKLQRIEQMTVPYVKPSEVALIGQALGLDLEALPLLAGDPSPSVLLGQALLGGARGSEQRRAAPPQSPDELDRPPQVQEGDDG